MIRVSKSKLGIVISLILIVSMVATVIFYRESPYVLTYRPMDMTPAKTDIFVDRADAVVYFDHAMKKGAVRTLDGEDVNAINDAVAEMISAVDALSPYFGYSPPDATVEKGGGIELRYHRRQHFIGLFPEDPNPMQASHVIGGVNRQLMYDTVLLAFDGTAVRLYLGLDGVYSGIYGDAVSLHFKDAAKDAGKTLIETVNAVVFGEKAAVGG